MLKVFCINFCYYNKKLLYVYSHIKDDNISQQTLINTDNILNTILNELFFDN